MRGRWQMLAVLLACAAPVIASYWAYFVVRPAARSNYADLIVPARPIPPALPLADLDGRTVAAESLRGQWLLVVVAGGACDAACESQLLLQRQLHQSLGAARERVDKLWLIDDAGTPRAATLQAIRAGAATDAAARGATAAFAATTVLRSDAAVLGGWLQAAPGRPLAAHLFVVDPRGDFMLRAPAQLEAARLKRDLDRLLRASASWDPPGRPR